MTTKELFEPLQQALAIGFGEGKWLMATAGSSPYLNYELIEKLQLDAAEVRRVAAAAAIKVPHVARVYTRDQLLRADVPNDRIGSRVLRGFNAQRSGDLEIRSCRAERSGADLGDDRWSRDPGWILGPGAHRSAPSLCDRDTTPQSIAPNRSRVLRFGPEFPGVHAGAFQVYGAVRWQCAGHRALASCRPGNASAARLRSDPRLCSTLPGL
jgi:hypothetical protein